MSSVLLLPALAMGFFGSPHCLGMCGGIVTAFSLQMQNVSPTKRNWLIVSYHVGRLFSYTLLGLVAGLIGATIFSSFMHDSLPRVLLGVVLVVIGLSMLGMPLLNRLERLGLKLWQFMSPMRQKVFPLDSIPKALAAGMLWGFLPCGLVYGALLMAVASHNVLMAGLLMFAFGLGTIPMLVATQKTLGFLQQKVSMFRLRQVNGALMMLSGLAVVFIPMAMHHLHGHHHHHGNHAEHHHAMPHDEHHHHHHHHHH